jgi:hypothetical protein
MDVGDSPTRGRRQLALEGALGGKEGKRKGKRKREKA